MSKVTVITPTWNQAPFIRDTIESVLNQTHKDIEYIIIDNLSDDGTEEIVNEYVSRDDRIVYVREADRGQAQAINKGLERATGQIVCWINSDDYYMDEKVLEKVCAVFESHSDVDIVVGDAWYCDRNKQLTRYEECDRKVPKSILSSWYYIVQPSVFWKKGEERLNEQFHYVFDWEFFIGLFDKGQVLYTHEPYSVYRMYEDNKTGLDNAKRKNEIYLLQKKLGRNSLNISWCNHVRKQYEKAEKTGNAGIKKRLDFWNRVLFHISGKRICSF